MEPGTLASTPPKNSFNPEFLDLAPGFDPEHAAQLVREHGVVVLRQVLDPARVKALAEQVTAAFNDLDARKETLNEADKRLLERMEMPVPDRDRSFRTRVENFGLLDSPKLIQTIEKIAGPYVWHFPPQVRRQNPKAQHAFLPYHQDALYTRHYNEFRVCWVPLTPCGADAPGLEIAIGHIDYLVKHESSGSWEEGLAEEEYKRLESLPVFAPVLFPGDVVLFDDKTFHRTYVPPNVSKTRLSFDFRAPPRNSIKDEPKKSRKFVDPYTRDYVKKLD
jgi:ectoine hydroxylase-related dioxygenase (phytanoyl-CoA dioxygenase family)